MDEFREKYHQSKIDLVFSQEASSFLKTLSEHPQIDSIQAEGNKASVFTENLEVVKGAILTLAARENWPLNKYEIGSISLEDVFMKVVQK